MGLFRFGVLACVAVFGCWRDNSGAVNTTPQLPMEIEASAHDYTAAYWCAIDEGFTYDRYPCVIRKIGDRYILAKLSGSQRFQGVITPTGAGFKFRGVFFCPWGACDKPLHGEFRAQSGTGQYRGSFRDDSMIVMLFPAPETAFGGVSYGGDGYGDPFGRGYRGMGLGGASYGLRQGPLKQP